MKLQTIHIDGFGLYHNYTLSLGPGLSLVYGPNEAGKSTLAAFVRGMLFGFPDGRSRENRYEPLRGGNWGGRLQVAGSQGGTYTIQRLRDRGRARPSLVVRDPSGSPLPDPDGAIKAICGPVDGNVFNHVFAFGLDELNDFKTLGSEQVSQRLFAASIQGSGDSVNVAFASLDDRLAGLYKASATSSARINTLSQRLQMVEAKRQAIAGELRDYAVIEARLTDLKQQREHLDGEIAEFNRARQEADQLSQAWHQWLELDEATRDLAALPEAAPLPAAGDQTIQALAAKAERLQESYKQAETDRNNAQETLKRLGEPGPLVDLAPALESLHEQRSYIRALLDEQQQQTGELRAARDKADGALRRLGSPWTAELVNAFEVSLQRRTALGHHEKALSAGAQTGAEQQRRVEICRRDLATVQEELEAHGEAGTADTEPIKATLDEQELALSALRRLVARQEMLNDRLAQQEAAIRDDERELEACRDGAQTAKDGSGAPKTPLIAAAVLGLAGLIAFFLGRIELGIAFLIAAIVMAGVSLTTKPSATDPAGQANALQRLEKRLADRRLAKAHTESEIGVVRDEAASWFGKLGAQGPLEPMAVDAVEGRLRQSQRKWDLAAAKQDQLDVLRKRLTRCEQALTEALAASTQAKAQHDEAQAKWSAWLSELGLPATVLPGDVRTLFDAVSQAQDALREVEIALSKQAGRASNLQAFRQAFYAILSQLDHAEPADDSAMVALLERLHQSAKDAVQLAQQGTEAKLSLEKATSRLDQSKAALGEADDELTRFLADCGVAAVEEFQTLWESQRKRQAAQQRFDAADRLLRAALGDDAQAQRLRETLATGTLNEWQNQRQTLAEAIEGRNSVRDDVLRQETETRLKLDQLASSADMIASSNERAALEEELRQAIREWRVTSLAKTLLSQTLARFKKERQPAVLKRAAGYFRQITGNAYTGLRSEDRDLIVVDAMEGERRSTHLSRGAMEQLYLCVRLGLAAELPGEALPLIMDDVLVNFDPERARQMATILLEAAQERQVVLFTCHKSTVDLFHSLQDNVPVHLLERFAGNLAPVAPADLGPVQAESSRGSDVAIDRAEQVSRTTAGDERLHDLCERVIAHLSSSPDQSRGDLFAAIPELEPQWNRVITQLKEQGRVSQEGQKRGAKYSLSVADSAPAPIEEITEEPFSSTFLF